MRATYIALLQGPSLRSRLCCPGPSSLNRPHPPLSQAHRNFAAQRFICGAFAVRERLARISTERNWPDNQLIWRTRLTESPCCVRQPNWCADSRLAQPLFVSCLNFYHLSFQATRYKKRLVDADFLPISGLLKLSMRDVPCAI